MKTRRVSELTRLHDVILSSCGFWLKSNEYYLPDVAIQDGGARVPHLVSWFLPFSEILSSYSITLTT